MKIAIVGAGWAGLAAAVQAVAMGHDVALFEASRTPGGRARAVPGVLPDGTEVALDNGQHPGGASGVCANPAVRDHRNILDKPGVQFGFFEFLQHLVRRIILRYKQGGLHDRFE